MKTVTNKLKMSFLETEFGVPIAYHLSGPPSDNALLICHGLGGHHLQWQDDAHFFAEDRQVLLVDLRGHGSSATPRNAKKSDFTLSRMADDVIAILQHTGLKKVDFLGNSLGGVIGLEIIRKDPGLIRSFASCGTTYELHLSPLYIWVKMLTYWVADTFFDFPNFVANKGTTYEHPRPLIRELFKSASREVTHLIDWNIYRYSYLRELKNFSGQILLLRGELDTAINGELNKHIHLFTELPNFHITELPGVGHFTNLDKPELFRAEVNRFLQTHVNEESTNHNEASDKS